MLAIAKPSRRSQFPNEIRGWPSFLQSGAVQEDVGAFLSAQMMTSVRLVMLCYHAPHFLAFGIHCPRLGGRYVRQAYPSAR
jgi:hypothetical protein